MKTIRIFISSPGDVSVERQKARQVIEQLQRRYAGRLKLASVLWEDLPLQTNASFQQGIDSILSADCGVDIAIFIIWSRLGTPTGTLVCRPDGTPYRSGTEREFELMLKAREASGDNRPAILAYIRKDEPSFRERIKSVPRDELLELIHQSELADQFIREEFTDPATGANVRAYHTFPEPASFAARLRVHLIDLIDPHVQGQNLPNNPWIECPFRGLEVFDSQHSQIYFGRDRAVCDVHLALREQAKNGCAFVMIVGPSGSGKSSLARAGVLPELTETSCDSDMTTWRTSVLLPGDPDVDCCVHLAKALAAESALPMLREGDENLINLGAALATAPETAINLRLKPALYQVSKGQCANARLLLLVDQLEELFTNAGATQKAANSFFAALHALAKSDVVWVLATVRSDFYARCQSFPDLMSMKSGSGLYDLLPPNATELRHIIDQPAWLAGMQYERIEKNGTSLALDEVIFEDAIGHADALPLLEYLLKELYERRTPDGVLTFEAYEALDGVGGALGCRAEAAYLSLDPATQSSLPEVLRELATVSDENEAIVVRQRAPLARIAGTPARKALVDRFLEERLFVADVDQHQIPVVRVAHEALLRRWDRASSWLRDNRDDLRIRKRLEQMHAHWLTEGRKPDFLLRAGQPLREATSLLRLDGNWIAEPLREYIAASAEAAQEQEQKQSDARALMSDSLGIESGAFARMRSIAKQVELLIAGGRAIGADCRRAENDVRDVLDTTQEKVASQTRTLDGIKGALDSAVESREELSQSATTAESDCDALGEDVSALSADHARAKADIARAHEMHASCLRRLQAMHDQIQAIDKNEQMAKNLLSATSDEQEAFDLFLAECNRLADFSARHSQARAALRECTAAVMSCDAMIDDACRLHLALGMTISLELQPSLGAADQMLTEQCDLAANVFGEFYNVWQDFEQACQAFEEACLGRRGIERDHAQKLAECRAVFGLEVTDSRSIVTLRGKEYGSLISAPHKEAQKTDQEQSAIEKLLFQLRGATRQIGEVKESLCKISDDLLALEASLADLLSRIGELTDAARALGDSARQLQKAAVEVGDEVRRILDEVSQMKNAVRESCGRVGQGTHDLTQTTAEIERHTRDISVIESLFARSRPKDGESS